MSRDSRKRDLERMEHYQDIQAIVLPEAEKELYKIQSKLKNNEPIKLMISKHAIERGKERYISYSNIKSVIEFGRVIECGDSETYRDVRKNQIKLLIMGNVKIRNRNRPLHVVAIIKDNLLIVKTAYDPRTKKWHWDKHYSKRVYYK